MIPKMRRFLASIAAAFVTCVVAATPPLAADVALTPIVADVLWAPRPMRGSDSQVHLVYEVRLSNPTPLAVSLEKVEVLDETGRVLLEMDKDTIAKRFSIGGRRGAEATSLAVGQFGVLFMHVSLPSNQAVPKSLSHRLSATLALSDQPARPFTVTVGETRLVEQNLLVLGPPLLGEGYLAGDGCCDTIARASWRPPVSRPSTSTCASI